MKIDFLSIIVFLVVTCIIPLNGAGAAKAAPDTAAIRKHVEKLDQSVWKKEVTAQFYEEKFIVPLWDKLRAAKDPFRVLAEVPFDVIAVGKYQGKENHELGITVHRFEEAYRELNPEEWKRLLDAFRRQGYRIEHTDWHHAEFKSDDSGNKRSVINFRIDLTRANQSDRVTLGGKLRILWNKDLSNLRAKHIDASQVTVKVRKGPPAFTEMGSIKAEDIRPAGVRATLSPVLVYDLNSDGLPEIIPAGMSLIGWNNGGTEFYWKPMTKSDPVPMLSGIIGDFTGDGVPDLLGSRAQDMAVVLLPGIEGVGFSSEADPIVEGKIRVQDKDCLTAGDIDGDGDLDAWVGQWRNPYYDGTPERYFDANDSFPSYLLINQGDGTFTDGTEASGLIHKRFRRTYSASFVDLDEDGDLDLLTVSDFAGVDLYHNDGKGKFTDVTAASVDEAHNFGMSHALADFDQDGKLDMYVTGMSSTTARRLERMKAGRSEMPEHNKMRMVMGYGNRMYLGQGHGVFRQPSFKDQVARTGWSWGVTSSDFDNDGDVDLFVANGHISGKSSKDYCTRFWCHDIYLPKEKKDVMDSVIKFMQTENILPQISWDGFQPNQLLLNEGEAGFIEAGHLLHVGQDWDSRSVVGADINGDGWQDLVVRWQNRSMVDDRLVVFINHLGEGQSKNWIGAHLDDGPGSALKHGATVRIGTESGERISVVVSGDSYRCQHPSTRHFGLGDQKSVGFLEVKWSDGKKVRIENPEINKYHRVAYPAGRKSRTISKP